MNIFVRTLKTIFPIVLVCPVFVYAASLHAAEPEAKKNPGPDAKLTKLIKKLPPKPPLVRLITLIDKPGRKGTDPLSQMITIGVELSGEAFYTLSFQEKEQGQEQGQEKESERNITSGRFNSGLNLISLSMGKRFLKTGYHQYFYILKLKAGDKITVKKIMLGIEVEAEKEKSDPHPSVYEISIYIGNHHVEAITKTVNRLEQLKSITKKAPYLIPHDPGYAVGENPAQYRAQVNPLALAFLAGKAIAKKIKKDKLKRMRYIRTRRLQGVHFPTNAKHRKVVVIIREM